MLIHVCNRNVRLSLDNFVKTKAWEFLTTIWTSVLIPLFRYSTVQLSTVQYSIVQYSTVQDMTVQHRLGQEIQPEQSLGHEQVGGQVGGLPR